MTQEQVDKLRLLDNKLNESEWDFDLLAEDIPSLDFTDFDIDWGLPEEEETVEEIIEDEVPDIPEEVKSQLGDLWILGEHRLICGDSTDIAVIDRLMDGVKADMVFCDAPYGYKYESNRQDKYEMLQNDDKILDFIPAIWGAMKDNCPVYEFCGWQSLKQWLEYFENTSLDLKNVIIWKKNNWSMGDLKGAYAGKYEVILYLNKGRVELNGARADDEVDVFALVALDTRQVGYILNGDMPTSLSLRVDSMRGTYGDEQGLKHYNDIMELKGKMSQQEIADTLGISKTIVNKMCCKTYKPYISNARYFSDIIREADWFEQI